MTKSPDFAAQTSSAARRTRSWRASTGAAAIVVAIVAAAGRANVNGEPIVDSPTDAIRTFYSSGIDALAIGPYLLRKQVSE